MWAAFSSPSPASDAYNTCTHTSIPLTPSCPLPPETSASSSFLSSLEFLEFFFFPAPVACARESSFVHELYLANNGLIYPLWVCKMKKYYTGLRFETTCSIYVSSYYFYVSSNGVAMQLKHADGRRFTLQTSCFRVSILKEMHTIFDLDFYIIAARADVSGFVNFAKLNGWLGCHSLEDAFKDRTDGEVPRKNCLAAHRTHLSMCAREFF